jgi:hypothetical protein
LYFLLNILFKIFSPKEIEFLEALFNSDKFQHRVIKKGLKFLKKNL